MVCVFPGGQAVHRRAALKAGVFAYTDEQEKHTNICRLSLLLPSVLQLIILVDSRRRVTAGSETKLEQWQVKPTRSHVVLMPQYIYSPDRDLVRFLVSLRFTAHLLSST